MISREIKEIRKEVDKDKAQLDLLNNQLKSEQDKHEKREKEYNDCIKARSLIQEVAKSTQQNLEYHISSIVTTAFHSIFPDPYNFVVEFVLKRNKTECNIWFEKDGEYFDPMFASGGGVLDVASFGLRASYRNLEGSRPVLILDEPLKFLSPDLRNLAAGALKQISNKLNIQIIMVTNLDELLDSADKVFEVNKGAVNG